MFRRWLMCGRSGSLVLLLLLVQVNCNAEKVPSCSPSSCGTLRNIRYPFRLKTDPRNCGSYMLVCENNRTVLYLSAAKYYVNAIDYHNYTIRVTDAGVQKNNCSSLPLYYLISDSDITRGRPPFILERTTYIAFTTCEKPVESPSYVTTAPCTNGWSSTLRQYSYVFVGKSLSDMKESCWLDSTFAIISLPEGELSFLDIHNALVHGFELSWTPNLTSCGLCAPYSCKIDEDTHEFLGCSDRTCYVRTSFMEKLLGASFWIEHLPYSRQLPHSLCILTRTFLTSLILVVYGTVSWFALRIIVGMPCTFAFLVYKLQRRHLSMYDTVEDFLQSRNNLTPIRYSYSDIKKMTECFKNKLGEGGYGSVFKGKLRSGQLVAIKVLSNSSKADGQEFINEVATIGRIHHVNVVRLIGFCVERFKRALVYDFMPNGSLEKYLFSEETNTSINSKEMYEISVGIARGIEYLHRGCNMHILHFDIKPHNILLDKRFTPKVSDFGLAKLYSTADTIVSLTAARGTIGYIAPELFYKNIGNVSHKADVYSFGMLLLEMAGRRKNLNASTENSSRLYFPSWVYNQLEEGKDIDMGGATNEERTLVKKMILVACWCIQMKPADRPSMKKVVDMLEATNELPQMPPNPFLSPQDVHVVNVVDHEITTYSIELSTLSGR